MQALNEDLRIRRLNLRRSTLIKVYRLASDDQQPDEVVSPLGVGGSSVVYTVYQELNAAKRIYIPRALKLFLMRDDLTPADADSSFVPAEENFLEEIRNVSQLSHENLVQVIDAGEYEFVDHEKKARRLPYIVSHLIHGCTLRDLLEGREVAHFARDKIRSNPEQAVSLVLQISNGLTYLHKKNLLHCDIAPKYIFLEDGSSLRAIIGDVGLSRKVDPDSKDKVFIAGTRSYSPDKIAAHFSQHVDARQLAEWFPYWDLYAFSKSVQELLGYVSVLTNRPWLQAAYEKATRAHSGAESLGNSYELAQQIEYCLPIHRQRGGVPELEPSAVLSRKRMMPIAALALTERVDALVRHPAMTRLQLVPQLTIVRAVSPGGNHTRYEHALGVMENVRRMLSTLIDEPSFLGVLGKDSIETGLVAALLYNAHRFPFSNIIHELNKRLPPGESKVFAAFGRDTLLVEVFGSLFASHKGRTLTQQLTRDFPSVDIEKLLRILASGSASKLQQADEVALYTLLNSSLDARVIDFVRRDSLHLGLSSGDAFELDDLLPHLTISAVRTGAENNKITLRQTGVSVAEQIILMRYWLYQRVYWNQPNRAFNAAVRRALLDLQETDEFEGELRRRALHVDEGQLLRFLFEYAREHQLASTASLVALVMGTEKVLYKEVFGRTRRQCESDPVLQDAEDLGILTSKTMSYRTMRRYEIALAVELAKRTSIGSVDQAPAVLLDVPFEPGHAKLGADIFVSSPSTSDPTGNDLKSLDTVSPIVAAVNSNFVNELQRLRILVRRDIATEGPIGQVLYSELRRLLQE